FTLYSYSAHPYPLSFPTRRSSDLREAPSHPLQPRAPATCPPGGDADRVRVWGTDGPSWPWCFSSARRRPLPSRPPLPRSPPQLRSEEHTSELQSRENLVCRLLLEK